MRYLFKTVTTMKRYNNKNWWIDRDIISDITINADNIKSALIKYQKIVNNKYCIEISNTAIKRKSEMYRDTENEDIQVGYVITGKTDFRDDVRYKWVSHYIDLWIEISIINNPFE